MLTIPRPADEEIFVGNPKHFDQVGEEFTEHLRNLCALRSSDAVLDIGSGIGRIASSLTEVITTGRYEGFDVVERGISWSRREISSRFPHFRFTHADVRNGKYAPEGRMSADTYRFPYPDAAFDVAFAASVYTHMMPADVERYLAECRRVLRGSALFTFYLWDETTERLIADDDRGRPTFRHDCGTHRIERIEAPEDVVAYPADQAFGMLEAAGFTIKGVHYGKWSGRADSLSWQDVVIVSGAGGSRRRRRRWGA